MTNDEANWKVFRRDTEAGRLLSRLYGVPSSSQKVNYPKQRRKRSVTISESSNEDEGVENDSTAELSSRPWRTTYSCQGWSKAQEEEREKERKNNIARALSLTVPKVGRGKQHSSRHTMNQGNNSTIHEAKVDQIPRRRTEVRCRHDQEEVEFVNKKYRPPCSYAKSSDEEKQRLNNAFVTKGGKCLPEDLTGIPAEAVAAANAKLSPGDSASHPQPNTLFDQIYQEIVERRQYQMDLEEVGAGDVTRDQTANEIRVRVEHLKKIDPIRATMVVKRMMESS